MRSHTWLLGSGYLLRHGRARRLTPNAANPAVPPKLTRSRPPFVGRSGPSVHRAPNDRSGSRLCQTLSRRKRAVFWARRPDTHNSRVSNRAYRIFTACNLRFHLGRFVSDQDSWQLDARRHCATFVPMGEVEHRLSDESITGPRPAQVGPLRVAGRSTVARVFVGWKAALRKGSHRGRRPAICRGFRLGPSFTEWELIMEQLIHAATQHVPWNKGKLVGQ
jgi:hypothetical protein